MKDFTDFVCVAIALFFLSLSARLLWDIRDILSDTRTIASETRDTVNITYDLLNNSR